MSISRTDRERLTLVIATLDLETKQAGERVLTLYNPAPEVRWRTRCEEAADTLRELIARREKEG